MLTTQRIADISNAFDFSAIGGQAWRSVRAIIAMDRPTRPDPLASLLPAGVPRYLRTWSAKDLGRIDSDDRVLLLGAGPAALEVVLTLADQGHRALVRLVSCSKVLPPALRLQRQPLRDAQRQSVVQSIAERLAALRAAGCVEVCAGRVTGAAAYDDTVVVDVLPSRRALHVSERFDWVVNCSSAPRATFA